MGEGNLFSLAHRALQYIKVPILPNEVTMLPNSGIK